MAIFCKPKATHQGEQLVQIFTKLLSRDRPDEIQLGAAKWWVAIWSSNCLFVVSFTPSFLPSICFWCGLCFFVSTSLSFHLFIHLSISLPTCLSVYQTACICAFPKFFFFFRWSNPSFSLAVYLFVCLSVNVSVHVIPFAFLGPWNSICLSINMSLTVSFNCPHMVQLCCLNELFEFLSLWLI